MDRKQIINIINNQSGIFVREFTGSEEEFNNTYQVGNLLDIGCGVKAVVVSTRYDKYADIKQGIVKYQILADVEIKKKMG